MTNQIIKIFLASSSELKEDREQFEIFINRKNKQYIKQGIFLELVIWEDFIDAMSATRLQDKYNKAIAECDVVISLFKTKVGQYTEEEVMTAWETFKKKNRPLIYTYFKEAQINVSQVNLEHLTSLKNFQNKLSDLGHFYTRYNSIEDLKYKFSEQLNKVIPNLMREETHTVPNMSSRKDNGATGDDLYYIERPPIEQQCYQELLKNGALIRVKASEKMGKTLLLEQIASFANQQNYKTVYLDFSLPGSSVLDESSQFLRWLCKRVCRKLKLSEQVDEVWGDLSPNTDCTDYFEDYILNQLTTPLVLELDNIEEIFRKKSAFDFFSMIRSWWGMRHKEGWKNLRLVLSYSTEALPQLPIHQSPFNVGLEILLPEFNQEQVRDLIDSHNLHWEQENIDKLMGMVSGHPYLISEGINYLANYPESNLDDVLAKAHTEEGIYTAYLQHHWSTLETDKDLADTLKKIVEANQSIEISPKYSYILEKMGLICKEGNKVKPRCQIYRLYFQERLKTLTW